MQPLHDRIHAPDVVPVPEPRRALTWRPMVADDAAAIHVLRRRIGVVDHPHYVVTLDEIQQDFERPEVDPRVDTILAQDPGGRIVAYGTSFLHTGQETLVKVLFDGGVDPDRRHEGIGRQLLEWQEQRGLQQLASSDKPLPGWLAGAADERAAGSLALFPQVGFELRRWWLELSRDLSAEIPVVPLDPEVRLETYGPVWHERARLARNVVFRDHWSSQPVPKDLWDAQARLPIARDDLSVVAVDPATEEVVGFVLCEVNEEEWEQVGHSSGYIGLVGVRREWRGRRIAQALLSHTLRGFRDARLEYANLDVDSESPTGALGLYEGIGFVPVNRSVSFVKEF